MNLYQIQTAKVGGMYSEYTNEQQCHHDIVMDNLIEIGPVVKNTIGNKATLALVYNRQHNPRTAIHFESFQLACDEREKLVTQWRKLNNSVTFIACGVPRTIPLEGLNERVYGPCGKDKWCIDFMYSGNRPKLSILFDNEEETMTAWDYLRNFHTTESE